MRLLNFGLKNGNKITNYDSLLATYSKVLRTEEPTNIGFIHIEKGGVVGYHQAPVPQLFIVVNGEGWIEGDDEKRVFLKCGEGVFWNKGEGHISGSDKGLMALVIQSEDLKAPSF
jgi:quercetin dioxygenase-like cupin family protein